MSIDSIIGLVSTWVPAWVFIALIAHFTVLGSVAYLILLERKVASWVQDRIGPNRVGLDFGLPFMPKFHFWGLGQPLADGLKFMMKEDYRAKGVDKILFSLAPLIMIIPIVISIVVIPWGGTKQTTREVIVKNDQINQMSKDNDAIYNKQLDDAVAWHVPWGGTLVKKVDLGKDTAGDSKYEITYRYPFQVANLNIGVLFILSILSLSVYGVVIAGYSSNNKFSFLGGLRATVNMISYELPLGLCILTIVVMYGSLDLGMIVERQSHYWWGFIPAWNVFTQPIAFFLFLVCIHAEANRAPFDFAEAEQELVGGYHTEYSSMRFALFFLAEYAGMITTSCVLVALFFGGWHFPGLLGHVDKDHVSVTDSLIVAVLRGLVFYGKAMVVMFVFIWVRWSLPRFRFDQLMDIAWRAMFPISLGVLVGTMAVVYYTKGSTEFGVYEKEMLMMLGMNVGVVVITMLASRVLPGNTEVNRPIRVRGSRYASPALTRTPTNAAPAV